jgi:fructose 1,6-bisphosphatase
MRYKPFLALMLVAMNLVVYHGHSQDTRTIKGEILSAESSPVPGLAVLQLGTDNAVVTDVNGQFELTVEDMGEVYLHLFGLDLEIFLKFQQGEDSKTVHLGDWKQLKRNNKKISNEWTVRNQN